MTPDEYEHLVADVLRGEGWTAIVTPSAGDGGIDVIAERDGVRLGVQAKMFLSANRRVNAEMVRNTYAAAVVADCDRSMVVTDGGLVPSAEAIAEKLSVEIRVVPAVRLVDVQTTQRDGTLTFGRVWTEHVAPLLGRTLFRTNGTTNEIVGVDSDGVTRITSNGKVQVIPIEVFRWVIGRLLAGETVLREDINDQYVGRASSGVVLILGATDLFEVTKVSGKQALRLKEQAP